MTKKNTRQTKVKNGLSLRAMIQHNLGEYEKKQTANLNKINLIKEENKEAKPSKLTAKQFKYFFINEEDLKEIHLFYPVMKGFSVAFDIKSGDLILFLETFLSALKKVRKEMDAFLTKRFKLDKEYLKVAPITKPGMVLFGEFMDYTIKGLEKLKFGEFELNSCMEDLEDTISWITNLKLNFDNGNEFKNTVKDDMVMYYSAINYKDSIKEANSFFKEAEKSMKEMKVVEEKTKYN